MSAARLAVWGGAALALLMGVMLAIMVAGPRSAEAQGEFNAGCPNELFGSDGPDELVGTPIGDRISLLAGDDRGFGAGGDDCLDGGPGNDVLDGGVGSDLIEGQAGNDAIVAGVGDDTIEADPRDGSFGNDSVNAGDGNDDVSTGGGADVIVGGAGNDQIDGGLSQNRIDAGPGNDTVASVNGIRERISCGSGRDRARLDVDDRAIGCESVRRLPSPTPTATPRIGKERTTFSVRFEAPFVTFRSRGYVARVSGPCGTSFEQEIGSAQSIGEVLRFRIAPRRGNRPGRFCGGTYLATVLGYPDAPVTPPVAPGSTTTTDSTTTTTPAAPVAPDPVVIGRAVFRVR